MNHEETIFEQALGIAAREAREQFLRDACAGNEAMFERLQGLLRAHDRAGKFLEHDRPADGETFGVPPSGGAAPGPAEAGTPNLLTEKPGDHIGRYKLLQKIGEGGCGVVYMAEQEEPVRRRVALKIIKLGMDTRQVIARFEAERQALALMDHPNIAKVFDAGASETGRPYFVMELVRGVKITEYCDEKKLTTHQRLELFMQVCRAVQHAHQKGIIHRDIKPSNILVTVNDGVAVPKVIDFGIAKATTGQQLTDKTLFTAFEQFVGTPAYMSPEQAVLTSVDIDTRSDIYALGVLLYELLTGKTPFDAADLLAIGFDEMRRTIREQEPPRPSTRLSTLPGNELSTTAQRRGLEAPKLISVLRGDLDWIVMKCLEKDRARRYETANGLASDIRRHLNNEPVVACPPSRLYEFQKTVRRHKFGFAAASGVMAALVIGLALALWQSLEKTRAYNRAVSAEQEQGRLRQQAQTEATKSQQVAQFLKDMLGGVGPSVAQGRDVTLLHEILDKTVEKLAIELRDQPEVQAELFDTLGSVYLDLRDLAKSEGMYRHALSVRRTKPDEPGALASSLHHLGLVLTDEGKFEEAEAVHREALTIQRELLQTANTKLADVLHALSTVLERQGKYQEAEPFVAEALGMYRKVAGNESFGVAGSLRELAVIRRNQGRLEEAEQYAREGLSIMRKVGSTPQLAWSIIILAEVLVAENKLEGAEQLFKEALELQRKVYGEKNAYLMGTLLWLSSILIQESKAAEAEPLLREAIDIQSVQALNKDAPRAFFSLADILRDQGRLDEARSLEQQGVELLRKLAAQGDSAARVSLANMYIYGDRFEQNGAEGLKWYRKAADSGDASILNNLAWLLATCPDPLLRDGTNSVVFAEKAVAATKRKNASYLDTLAASYAEDGQFEKAISLQQEALRLAKDDREKEELESHLKLFTARKPCRDSSFSVAVASFLASRVRGLLMQDEGEKAEVLARKCLEIREQELPDNWLTFNSRSQVGGSLLLQKKYGEAEPLLLSGYAGMKEREDRIPPAGKVRLKETAQRLVRLYEETGRMEKADEWTAELAEIDRQK